jgi:hypothetical protein
MPVSGIESLPVELLQPIYFQSGYNVALLQASDRIGARLSSDYVYNATCSYHMTGIHDDRTGQTAAQTYIFATKWMTWLYFKSWVTRNYESSGCLCGSSPDQGCFDPQWPPNFENATEMMFSRSHLPRLAFVKPRIPMKLLRGPWTQDKIQFLQFLMWITSMSIDWRNSDVRVAAIAGRMQAIREGNIEAVALFNHVRRLGKVADLPLIRYAVIYCGCNRSIVYDLLSTARMWGTTEDWKSDELDAWCEERIAAGDSKGNWLKTKLRELRVPGTPGIRRASSGKLESEAGNYDGGLHDQLVVKQHKWNQVSKRSLWLHHSSIEASSLFLDYFCNAQLSGGIFKSEKLDLSCSLSIVVDALGQHTFQ